MEDAKNSIFALKTSAGQERNVARLLAMKADKPGLLQIMVCWLQMQIILL